jgi:hypothetical protein
MLFGVGMAGLIVGLVCLGIYFLPSIIAYRRKHKNLLAIFALNIFFGWTLFGWVGALVWSLLRRDS